MSKTHNPPSEESLKRRGIRFIPTNGYSPNHYSANHLVFGFSGEFDTRDDYSAQMDADLANTVGRYLDYQGFRNKAEADALLKAVLRMLGSESQLAHLPFTP